MRDKKRYGPQHKESDLEKCINLLVTRWQKEDGITPSQPAASPFHTCPKCSYKLPLPETKEAHEEARVYNAVFELVLKNMLEEDRKKQEADFNHGAATVPTYIRPVGISTGVMTGYWYAQGHDSKCASANAKPYHARTAIFGDKLDDEDSSGSSDWREEEEEEEK